MFPAVLGPPIPSASIAGGGARLGLWGHLRASHRIAHFLPPSPPLTHFVYVRGRAPLGQDGKVNCTWACDVGYKCTAGGTPCATQGALKPAGAQCEACPAWAMSLFRNSSGTVWTQDRCRWQCTPRLLEALTGTGSCQFGATPDANSNCGPALCLDCVSWLSFQQTRNPQGYQRPFANDTEWSNLGVAGGVCNASAWAPLPGVICNTSGCYPCGLSLPGNASYSGDYTYNGLDTLSGKVCVRGLRARACGRVRAWWVWAHTWCVYARSVYMHGVRAHVLCVHAGSARAHGERSARCEKG